MKSEPINNVGFGRRITLLLGMAVILATLTVTIVTATPAAADLSTSTKSANRDEFQAGDTVVYTIELINSGDNNTGTFMMSDTLPADLTYVDGSVSAPDTIGGDTESIEEDNGTITWSGSIGGEASLIVSFRATLDAELEVGDMVTNTAVISHELGTFSPSATISIVEIEVEPNDNKTIYLPLLRRPDDSTCYYITREGYTLFEFEDIFATQTPDDDWRSETDEPGYTGGSYVQWHGPDYFGEPGNAILTFNLYVTTPGFYEIRLRNFHEAYLPNGDPDGSERNDVWVRMNDDRWIKLFSGIDYPIENFPQWTWNSNFEIGTEISAPVYLMETGLHELQFSARSEGFGIDRVAFFLKENQEIALDLGTPARTCEVLPLANSAD